ncbi:MAG: RNA methyltransferase [Chitinophagaceae bacterium]|nr:RNA methyltransferase [Chitinophagaceae bacterium]
MDELNRKSLSEFSESEKFPVAAVLENIRSAYNVGSVFRTADAFMLKEIILIGYTAHPPHKQIMKTALGAEESVTWKHFKTSREALEYLKEEGYFLFGVEQTDESVMLQDLGEYMNRPVAFIFGNEVTGVELETLKACDRLLEIPQFGTKHSLNISVAAGTVLWEAIRNVPAFAQLQKG